jgi:hypothetical protein
MTKKCAIHLKGGTILNTTYNDEDIEGLFDELEKAEGYSECLDAWVRLDQIAAIEWID